MLMSRIIKWNLYHSDHQFIWSGHVNLQKNKINIIKIETVTIKKMNYETLIFTLLILIAITRIMHNLVLMSNRSVHRR